MRPEHSETKAKTETRECKTEIETETVTKKSAMRPRPKKYETKTETETSPVKSIARESNTNRYVLFFITHMRWMINRKWTFAFKMIRK